jgi:1-phosphofructokinase
MLLIITPNPALDRTMIIPGLRLGALLRAERVLVAAGGKGLNVARAAKALGMSLRVCAPLGGLTGQMVAEAAAAEGFEGRWSWHQAGETRTCVLLVDPEGDDTTALNERGPVLAAYDWQGLVETILSASVGCKMATISGSLPPGITADKLGDLIEGLEAFGLNVLVDTSGLALIAAIAARPYGLKVNASELGAALGRTIERPVEAAQALAELRAWGLGLVAVSLGPLGAVAADASGTWWAKPPTIAALSSVGCGDSLMAGLASGLLGGQPLPEALRLGVACGSADALTIGGGLIDMPEVARMSAAIELHQI